MQEFFNTLQKGDKESEQRLNEVLRGGKGEVKRASSVDKSLYGTEAGVQAKKKYEEQQAIAQAKKKQKKMAAAKQAVQKAERKDTVVKVATVGTVVGVAAAALAFLIGGNRSR